MDLTPLMELLKAFGPVGAILLVGGYWLTRHLIPSMQADADETRKEFTASLNKLTDTHHAAVTKVVDGCKEERQQTIDALRGERQATVEALERAYGVSRNRLGGDNGRAP